MVTWLAVATIVFAGASLAATTPSIISLSPTSGAVGTAVTITGTNFGATQGSSAVQFNGTTATPTSWSETGIIVPVPNGATTGDIVVTVSGVASNGVNFTVSPSIASISPTSGAVGTMVTIVGSNFGTTQRESTVTFNGTAATPTSWNDTKIVVHVPSGASTGLVASNRVPFTVSPVIIGLSPVFGPVGTSVAISGSAFGTTQETSTVTFNGVAAMATSWGSQTIMTQVPGGATTGPVVATVAGAASNSLNFLVGPGITSLNPISGATGTSVTITGSGFGSAQAGSTVTFNGVLAIPASWSGTSIIVPVPSGATTGLVLVTVGGASSNGALFAVSPSIAGISPASGPVGAVVTIFGSNFGATQGTGSITFTGVAATPTSWSPNKIVTAVPSGAATGPVVVTAAGQASSGVTFAVGTGSMTGRVSRAIDGSGVSGALVEALQLNVTQVSATTATDGTYTISSLAPATYDVRVSVIGYGTAIITGNNVAASGTTTVNASLGSPGTISGKVTRTDRITPVSGASVTALEGGDTAGTVTTDSTGSYNISNLAAGSYIVQSSAEGFNTQSQTGVSVTAGNTTAVNLTLSGQSQVTYVYDELGRLVGAIDPAGNAAAYYYDAVGNLLSISRYTPSQISVLNFTPKKGPVGTTVTIMGTGFSARASQDTINFNGTIATIKSAMSNQILTTVPTGATTGPISITTPAGTLTISSNFTVTANTAVPTITSFTPIIATPGTSLTITGTNFDPNPTNDRLRFNTMLQAVTSATSTTISTSVGAATSGYVYLSTPGGSAVSNQDLFIPFGIHVSGDVGFTGRTILGSTATVSIGTPSQIGLLLFDAREGEKISLNLSGSTFSSCALYLFGPSGTQLTNSTCTNAVSFVDSTSLRLSGTHMIGIDPTSSTGEIKITLNNATDVMGTITIGGTPLMVTTTVPGQNASLTFSGLAGQRVSMNLTNGSYSTCNLTLKNPDGSYLADGGCSGASNFIDTATLRTTGTYMILIDPQGIATGSVTLQLNSVPPDFTGTITIDGPAVRVPTTGDLAVGQSAGLTLSATAGQNDQHQFVEQRIRDSLLYVRFEARKS